VEADGADFEAAGAVVAEFDGEAGCCAAALSTNVSAKIKRKYFLLVIKNLRIPKATGDWMPNRCMRVLKLL
jgi:hypothetical protein